MGPSKGFLQVGDTNGSPSSIDSERHCQTCRGGGAGDGNFHFSFIKKKSLNLSFVSNRNKRRKKKEKEKRGTLTASSPACNTKPRCAGKPYTVRHPARTPAPLAASRILPQAQTALERSQGSASAEKPLCLDSLSRSAYPEIELPPTPLQSFLMFRCLWQQPDSPAGLQSCNSVQNLSAGARTVLGTFFRLKERGETKKKKYCRITSNDPLIVYCEERS